MPHIIAIVLINAIGVYFCRTNEDVKEWVEDWYISVFFFVLLGSFLLSGIKGKVGNFFMEVAWQSRFYVFVFIPILLASIIE